MKIIRYAIVLLLAAPAGGAEGFTQPWAEVRQRFDSGRTELDNRDYLLSTTKARVGSSYQSGEWATELVYDMDLRLSGDYFGSADAAAAGINSPLSQTDFGFKISDSNSSRFDHRPYRAWAGWSNKDWTVRAGRQSVLSERLFCRLKCSASITHTPFFS